MNPHEKKNFIKLQTHHLRLQYKVCLYELDGIDPPETLLTELADIQRLLSIILRSGDKSVQNSNTHKIAVPFKTPKIDVV